MSLRLTVAAAAGLGLLATPCAGINVGKGVAVVSKAATGSSRASADMAKCEKLNVEPTVKEEYALGGALAVNWVQRGGGLMIQGSANEALHTYINTVGKNLGAQSARPTLDWTFGVLDDAKTFSALSAPGGYVFLTRRLLQDVENEGQLAGVLAHEIAHIVLKHAIHKYNDSKVSTCKLYAGGGAIAGALLPPNAVSLLTSGGDNGNLDLDGNPSLLDKLTAKTLDAVDSGNSKDEELEADRMAAQLMLSAGYDPDEFRRLIAKTENGGGMLDKHPSKTDRVKNLHSYIESIKPKKGEEAAFAELSLDGLRSPPLPAAFAVVQAKGTTGVARDTK